MKHKFLEGTDSPGIMVGLFVIMSSTVSREVRGHPIESWPKLIIPHLPALIIIIFLMVAWFIGWSRSNKEKPK